MNEPVLRRWQDAPVKPWLNGGGVSRDLWVWPDAQAWTIRVGVADIDRSGPFSAYPGVTRWFSVLDGAGVRLELPDGSRTLTPADEACCFDGAAAPGCELLAGKTLDLNLMLRGADGLMRQVADGQPWQPPAGQCGLYTRVAGRVMVETSDGSVGATSQSLAVPAMALLWWPVAPARLVFQSDAVDGALPSDPPAWWLAAAPHAGEVRR